MCTVLWAVNTDFETRVCPEIADKHNSSLLLKGATITSLPISYNIVKVTINNICKYEPCKTWRDAA